VREFVMRRFTGFFGRRGEDGIAAVWTALMMPVFLGIAALALDVGVWHLTAARLQKAADAAALAGVPYLPDRLDLAKAAALSSAAQNGYTNGVNGTSVSVAPVSDHPSQLKVTVSTTAPTIFGVALGVSQVTLTRMSVADYTGPLQMGSPCNEYGQDPDPSPNAKRSAACNGVVGMWGQVYGAGEMKNDGDAFQAAGCDSATDGCVSGTNVEYNPNGYYYRVHISQPLSGKLSIEAFDPMVVDVGAKCETIRSDGSATDLRRAKNKYHNAQSTPTADDRYAGGVNSPFCTGDYDGSTNYSQAVTTTTFTVLGPSTVAGGAASFPPVCTSNFGGVNLNPSNPDALFNMLDKGSSSYDDTLAQNFRQWVPLCTLDKVDPGDYLIQVSTTAAGNLPGQNSFSLRAFASSPADNLNVSISGYGSMSAYANTPNGSTDFYLARLSDSARGKTLTVRLFDLGEGTTSGSYLQVLPPDPVVNGTTLTTFTGCTGQGPATVQSSCRVDFGGSFNGKWQTLKVPIPDTFSCAETVQLGCWVRLHLSYASGSSPHDATSWQASLDGDPVRLVQ
jgi:Flp pilus assembly protein TadG